MSTRVSDLGKGRCLDRILRHEPALEQKDVYVAVSQQWGEAKSRNQFDLRNTWQSELPPFFLPLAIGIPSRVSGRESDWGSVYFG